MMLSVPAFVFVLAFAFTAAMNLEPAPTEYPMPQPIPLDGSEPDTFPHLLTLPTPPPDSAVTTTTTTITTTTTTQSSTTEDNFCRQLKYSPGEWVSSFWGTVMGEDGKLKGISINKGEKIDMECLRYWDGTVILRQIKTSGDQQSLFHTCASFFNRNEYKWQIDILTARNSLYGGEPVEVRPYTDDVNDLKSTVCSDLHGTAQGLLVRKGHEENATESLPNDFKGNFSLNFTDSKSKELCPLGAIMETCFEQNTIHIDYRKCHLNETFTEQLSGAFLKSMHYESTPDRRTFITTLHYMDDAPVFECIEYNSPANKTKGSITKGDCLPAWRTDQEAGHEAEFIMEKIGNGLCNGAASEFMVSSKILLGVILMTVCTAFISGY